MITDKARELSQQARDAAERHAQTRSLEDRAEQNRLANEFFTELFTNCVPTEDEWAELSTGVLLTGRGLWKLIEHIAQRQALGL